MTNEEAIEILTAAGKRRAKPELFDALDMGIAALKSQERMRRELKSLDGIAETCDNLEKALNMIACQIIDFAKERDCAGCPLKGSGIEKWGSSCKQKIVEYYKRRAGIEVAG